MLDGRRQTQAPSDRPAHALAAGIGTPRLLNAAAWLQALAALEAEFKTILEQDRPASEQPARQRRA